jgi:hypothetical protein
MARRRLQKELEEIESSPSPRWFYELQENTFEWQMCIYIPEELVMVLAPPHHVVSRKLLICGDEQ